MTTSDGSTRNLADTNAQPSPERNDKPAVWSLVMRDMTERDIFGAEKYGTRLQPGNGRDFLLDAYQEALDLVVYLRGAIYERDELATVKESLTVRPAHTDPADVDIASAIDDDSERMQAIGQNVEMADEVYAAVDQNAWANCELESLTSEARKYARDDMNGFFWSERGRKFNMNRWRVLRWIK